MHWALLGWSKMKWSIQQNKDFKRNFLENVKYVFRPLLFLTMILWENIGNNLIKVIIFSLPNYIFVSLNETHNLLNLTPGVNFFSSVIFWAPKFWMKNVLKIKHWWNWGQADVTVIESLAHSSCNNFPRKGSHHFLSHAIVVDDWKRLPYAFLMTRQQQSNIVWLLLISSFG